MKYPPPQLPWSPSPWPYSASRLTSTANGCPTPTLTSCHGPLAVPCCRASSLYSRPWPWVWTISGWVHTHTQTHLHLHTLPHLSYTICVCITHTQTHTLTWLTCLQTHIDNTLQQWPLYTVAFLIQHFVSFFVVLITYEPSTIIRKQFYNPSIRLRNNRT